VKSRAHAPQLSLFTEATPAPRAGAADRSIASCVDNADYERAEQLPGALRFGTSSWTFGGWENIVYGAIPSEAALLRAGPGGALAAYAEQPLFRCVGLDRSYYAPVSEKQLADYASTVPSDFRFASKVWSELTTPRFGQHPRYGARAGKVNERFLLPEFARELAAGFRTGLGMNMGPLIVEFPPMPRGTQSPAMFCQKLAECMGPIAGTVPIAIELRNRELFTAGYIATLREIGATHVYNYWSGMPSIADQATLALELPAPHVVMRLLLPQGKNYADQKADFAPFNRIVAEQPNMRRETVDLILQLLERGSTDLYVLVNNKAEGCAPLTVRALADLYIRKVTTRG
jgi:uncharacterized protein YecE (DUF72 family)